MSANGLADAAPAIRPSDCTRGGTSVVKDDHAITENAPPEVGMTGDCLRRSSISVVLRWTWGLVMTHGTHSRPEMPTEAAA